MSCKRRKFETFTRARVTNSIPKASSTLPPGGSTYSFFLPVVRSRSPLVLGE